MASVLALPENYYFVGSMPLETSKFARAKRTRTYALRVFVSRPAAQNLITGIVRYTRRIISAIRFMRCAYLTGRSKPSIFQVPAGHKRIDARHPLSQRLENRYHLNAPRVSLNILLKVYGFWYAILKTSSPFSVIWQEFSIEKTCAVKNMMSTTKKFKSTIMA